MKELVQRIQAVGIVPVVKLGRAEDARVLGRALRDGGLPIAEITFRTAAAPDAIRLLRAEFPELLVGAGTVLTIAQADAAIEAGASFAVAPGFNPRIVDHCLARGLPMVPGVNAPSQVEQGLERGLTFLKFFPAEASGGVPMLKALHGPYAEVTFMPTGGIDPKNLGTYLALPYVVAAGGSWMVKEELLAAGKHAELAALCGEAVRLAASLRAAKK
ncbi:MAG TPA: bifunctional 4-hydroxy-2-oxoglutarate aldolase/2-dehydro-3-deoxy-phosphogluconate aldolase [Anaeromyxobacter sp.]|nr:bifunctional 4-hydroxy-2-oxoglutarate aldolase/2-dehydro-3-deoxy-phosphogluconate aldolase [Anaeromyxobacter sp.]